jgi:excisionase family DNA binding protein
MQIPMTPPQVAKQLGVATVTVYKWIESKKLKAEAVKCGHTTRLYIDPNDVEIKRIELEENHLKVNEHTKRANESDMLWVRQYQDLIGKIPPLYLAWRNGRATFEQMKAEAHRRFDALR